MTYITLARALDIHPTDSRFVQAKKRHIQEVQMDSQCHLIGYCCGTHQMRAPPKTTTVSYNQKPITPPIAISTCDRLESCQHGQLPAKTCLAGEPKAQGKLLLRECTGVSTPKQPPLPVCEEHSSRGCHRQAKHPVNLLALLLDQKHCITEAIKLCLVFRFGRLNHQ